MKNLDPAEEEGGGVVVLVQEDHLPHKNAFIPDRNRERCVCLQIETENNTFITDQIREKIAYSGSNPR